MQILDRTGVGTLWSICKTKFALKDHTHNYLPLSGGTLTGDLLFSDSGTTFRQIKGTCGGYDFWRIGGGATKENAGYMEIATADDGAEPIYIRQYIGVFATAKRTATILDSEGNTSFPGTVAAAKFKGGLEGNASTASSASTVNGYTVNANVPSNAKFTDTEYVIPTLSSAPTSSTLTFTDNGVTRSFKVGYMCRVADSSAEHGYKFYQLYDISGNNAVWGEISGGSVEINEVVSISLVSNQSNSDTALNGATIIVTNTDTGNVISTHQWEGTELKLKIVPITHVSISVSSVKGYRSPESKAFTTGVGSTRNVTMQYDTEVVTITVTANNGASMNGQVVTTNNETHTYNGPYSVKVPFGVTYSVSANKKSGYSYPLAVTYTANQKSRSVTLSYTHLPIGIYIFDTDRNFTLVNNWDKSNNKKAVGVYLGTENTKIVIAPYSIAADKWGRNDYAVPGITADSEKKAKKDYSGKLNTDKIVASGNTYYAAQRCRGYKFINGEKGYLWALGELTDVFNNYPALSKALGLIGGGLDESLPYWSSTQYSESYVWTLRFSTGYTTASDKTESYMVHAVFGFD
jgi:hypothetical protein